jgi:cytochrome c2
MCWKQIPKTFNPWIVLGALAIAISIAGILTGCSGPAPTAGPPDLSTLPAGDPQAGKELFARTQEIAGAPTCKTCHVTEAGAPAIVGPNLSGIAERAGQRVEGQTDREYLYTSIVDPYAYVLEGYQSSIMVRNYAELLTPQQLADLVAYLMTL